VNRPAYHGRVSGDGGTHARGRRTDAGRTPPRGRRRGVALAIALGSAFVLLGTGSLFAGVAVGTPEPVTAPTSAPPTPEADPTRPVPAEAASTVPLRTCSIAGAASDPRLRALSAAVVDSASGQLLFDRGAGTPARSGSVLKVLTAAAALSELGPDHRMSTTVVDGGAEGTVVLVGGGDPTLSRLGAGQESVYAGAPTLGDLARQTIATWQAAHPDEQITELVLDATFWDPADKWDESWARSEQTIGYHSEVTALQVDGDRADPARETSPRSTDPVARAGQFFRDALWAADTGGVVSSALEVSTGAAPQGTPQLGRVESQPVGVLVGQFLTDSDNSLAESLARVVSKHQGRDGSAASLTDAYVQALGLYGIDTTGLAIRDGSGLSEFNGVPPLYVAQLMTRVAAADAGLGPVRDALPVAGQSGTLQSRFTGDDAVARGQVRAKTGWIDTAYTLAGVIDAEDGTTLTFAFYAIGEAIDDDARAALDTLTTAAWRCGGNLSNL